MSSRAPMPHYPYNPYSRRLAPPSRPSSKIRRISSEPRLQPILEHESHQNPSASTPGIPEKSPFRYQHRNLPSPDSWWHWSSKDALPPPYSDPGEILKPKEEKATELQSGHGFTARRGGWGRLCVFLVVAIAVIGALVVGLAVGLSKKHASKRPASSTSVPFAIPSSQSFPVGSYAIRTYLATMTTNCTSNPSTWRCYPYSTYTSASPSSSSAIYDWIISPSTTADATSQNYTMSSTANPFAPSFHDVPLTLLDGGLDTEHYAFSISMNKTVIPSAPLTDDDSQSICFYPETTLRGRLYTRQKPSTSNATTTSSSSTATPAAVSAPQAFQPWPYAAQVEQLSAGGASVPECYQASNGVAVGARLGNLSPEAADDSCSCVYQNYDLAAS
ncbi:MAG: hypothetical protein M1819_000710 [Sarea resinae]|nr:MAG: hypothetical protein M1819_000710 [Sarea resinae]